MHALLLNGPPGSGKDRVAEYLARRIPSCAVMKFAKPIVDFMFTNFGIRVESVEKDVPRADLHGRSVREVMQAYSEKLCKPMFGIHYFGHCAVAELRKVPSSIPLAIFSDSGFVQEVVPLLTALGGDNLKQVILRRPGKTFEGDTRSYWDHPHVGRLEFENPGDGLLQLKDKVDADLLPEVLEWAKL